MDGRDIIQEEGVRTAVRVSHWATKKQSRRRFGAGQKRDRQTRWVEEKGIKTGFPRTQWRRLHDSRVRAETNWLAWWSKTLAIDCWLDRVGPASKPHVVLSGKEKAPFCREQRCRQV